MANILLITYFFPPHNSIPCRRVYSWAKYLKKLGHEVVILTAETPGDSATKSFDADLSFLKIYRLKYLDLINLMIKIVKPGDLLNADFKAKDKKILGVFFIRKMLNIINNCLSGTGILFWCSRFPTFFEDWFFRAYKAAKVIIRKHNIDVIITSSPPVTVNLVGLSLKKEFKEVLWVADYRDLWVDNPVHKGLFPFTVWERFYEKRCIGRSDVIITVSEVLKRHLQNKYPLKKQNIFCIENGFDEDLLQDIHLDSSFPENIKKTIVYSGTLYEDRRNPELLFKTVEKNYEYFNSKLKIIFYGNYETKRILDKFFNRYIHVKDIIMYGGFISSGDILARELKADALLFLEKDTDNDGILTGKIFEYMMFKKNILCIGINPPSYIGGFLEKTGLCTFCGEDGKKIGEALNLIIDEKIKIMPNEDYINNFSRKKQVDKLDIIIKEYLNRK